MSQAKLIVIDGGDNVGKATQSDLLMRRLLSEGHAVGKMDFPRYNQNTFGHLIRDNLSDAQKEVFLSLNPKIASTLFAADRFESKEELLTWLKEGRVVILDRYVSANMLNQGAKIGDADEREEFFRWVEHVEYEIFGMPKPDLTIFLDIAPDQSQKLLEYVVGLDVGVKVVATEDIEKLHQTKVSACAEYLSTTQDHWSKVECLDENGLRLREDIHEEVYNIVKEHLS